MSQWIVEANDVQFQIGGYKIAVMPKAKIFAGFQAFGLIVWGPNDSDWREISSVDITYQVAPPTNQDEFDSWKAGLIANVNAAIQTFYDENIAPVQFPATLATTYNDAAQYIKANLKFAIVDNTIKLTEKA